jgi:hypothetical protein
MVAVSGINLFTNPQTYNGAASEAVTGINSQGGAGTSYGPYITPNNSSNTSYTLSPGPSATQYNQQQQQTSSAPQAPSAMNPADQNAWALANGYTGWNNYMDNMNSMKSATGNQAMVDEQAARNEYNYLSQQLEGRKGELQSAYDTGNKDIDIGIGQTQGAYTQNKTDLGTNYDLGKNQNQQNYQTTQRKNREMARAVGAGTSSDYLNMQGTANNQFSQTDSQMNQDYSSKVNKLNTDWTAANQYAQNQKADLANKLQQGMRSIVLDQNATDFRKADAIAKIKAQAQTQMASIDAQVSQFQQTLMAQAQQLAAYTKSMGTTTAGTNYLGMANTGMPTTTTMAAPQQATVYGAGADTTKSTV